MEAELRQKIYDMHGTVQSLDEKVDAVDEKLDRLDGDLEDVEETVDEVDNKAQSNRNKIIFLSATGTVLSTLAIIGSQLFGGILS